MNGRHRHLRERHEVLHQAIFVAGRARANAAACRAPRRRLRGTARLPTASGGPVAVSGSNAGSNPMRMHLPSALSPGQTVRAMVSLTIDDRRATIVARGELPALERSRCRGCRRTPASRPEERQLAVRRRAAPPVPGTPIGGTLKPANGIACNRRSPRRRPASARTRSSAASNSSAAIATAPGPWLEVDDDDVVHVASRSPAPAGCRGFVRTCRRRRAARTDSAVWRTSSAGLRRRSSGALAFAIETAPSETRWAGSRRWRCRPRWRRGGRQPPRRAACVRPAPSPGATSGSSTCLTAPSNHDGQQQRHARRRDRQRRPLRCTPAGEGARVWRPSAARMANSRRRRDARTSSSVAALASPMTRTRADTPVSQ